MSFAASKRTLKNRKPSKVPPPSLRQSHEVAVPDYFARKSTAEKAVACVLLVLALPVIGLAIVCIRLTSRGPGIYRQLRVGLHGRTFTMYKLRTMCENAEVESGAVWAQLKDPRVTLLGRFLRTAHLDELPQLFNIVKGEMSLVGPRPERPEFVQKLAKEIPSYLSRLAIRPGLTGLAQVNLPPDSDLNSVRRKTAADLEYIPRASLLTDCRILFATFLKVIGIRGPVVMRLLAISVSSTCSTQMQMTHREARII